MGYYTGCKVTLTSPLLTEKRREQIRQHFKAAMDGVEVVLDEASRNTKLSVASAEVPNFHPIAGMAAGELGKAMTPCGADALLINAGDVLRKLPNKA